jgi:hypothetical protein
VKSINARNAPIIQELAQYGPGDHSRRAGRIAFSSENHALSAAQQYTACTAIHAAFLAFFVGLAHFKQFVNLAFG